MTPTKTKRANDTASAEIARALRAVSAAQKAAYDDMRTNGTPCTDYLDSAVKQIEDAAEWMRGLLATERADEHEAAKPKPEPKPKPAVCQICGEAIAPDDLAICSGCERPICPGDMGDNECCLECEREEG